LGILHEQAQRFQFHLKGYCLMTNHVHLIGVPEQEDSLAKAIGRTHYLYSNYINKMHGRNGHLWQNRFYSCPMDDEHECAALCYAELNPVRAGLVRNPWEYEWSSAAFHCGKIPADPWLDITEWRKSPMTKDWAALLKAIARDTGLLQTVRYNTHTGRPLGSDSFLSKLEHCLGRRLRALPVGRPEGWRKKHARTQNNR